MATPGVLRLLAELADGTIEEFTPLIDEDGRVSYPDAQQHLDARDGDPFEVLETLASRGILYREFRDKVYVCPDCGADGMRFMTICPGCGSPNTIEQELLEHIECGGVAPRDAFQANDGEYMCPECDLSLHPEHIETLSQHVCQTCGERAADPVNSLRCRECVSIYEPEETIEWVLYSYGFERDGESWLETQLSARRSMAGMLRERDFNVEVDTTITNEAGNEEIPVHIRGEDELLGDRVIVAVHERPISDDVERLQNSVEVAGARGVLITTSGAVSEQAEELARRHEIGVLSLQQDGSLKREYETATDVPQSSVFERLTSSVRQQFSQ
ncbi:hypothetical protein [Halocatena marina]|uniref:Thaumarchaeal output domain-containing protein n=1 Tax=Halocatena marina TaxID=2934937 RepID=A0ABD5YH47_9EURY|nr:hypothetical protein [Halocatena marina]